MTPTRPKSPLKTEEEKDRWWRKLTRDLALFWFGIVIISHEVFVYDGDERTQILILAGGLVGSPFIIRAEEARRKKNGNGK